MNALEKMKVGRRIGLGFALIMILLAVTTALSIWHLQSVAEATRDMMRHPLAKERLVADWYRNIHSGIRRAMAIAKSPDESLTGFFEDDDAASSKSTAELSAAIEKLLASDAERAQFRQTLEARNVYVSAREAIKTAKSNGNAGEAARILEQDFMPAAGLYQERVHGLLDLQRKSIDAIAAEIDAIYLESRNQLIVLGVLALLLGTAAAFVIARSLLKQLGGEPSYAAEIAGKIAAGDLAVEVRTEANDRSSLLFAMKSMRDSLADIVSRVRAGTDTIATASGQISAGNMDLSSRTEQQASSLEETAASMEELTSTVKQNADNARQANGLAASASEVAIEGGELVSQAMRTMASINASSQRIVDITGVIDGIAFQTNILALNAAVEAARAGEQGRGFAVVAGEVRALAKRSAAAAKEIKALIDESVENVDAGTSLVNQAGRKMEEIVASVRRVTDIMAEIAAASREQSEGIEQVNRAVGQMDEVTQQNAALVEEAAAATESLQEQANKLVQVVGVFKLAAAHGDTHEAAHETAPAPDVSEVAMVQPHVEPHPEPHVAANVAVLTPKKPSAPLPAKLVTAREQTRRIANARDEGIGEWEEF